MRRRETNYSAGIKWDEEWSQRERERDRASSARIRRIHRKPGGNQSLADENTSSTTCCKYIQSLRARAIVVCRPAGKLRWQKVKRPQQLKWMVFQRIPVPHIWWLLRFSANSTLQSGFQTQGNFKNGFSVWFKWGQKYLRKVGIEINKVEKE